jgi:hypothetical protein
VEPELELGHHTEVPAAAAKAHWPPWPWASTEPTIDHRPTTAQLMIDRPTLGRAEGGTTRPRRRRREAGRAGAGCGAELTRHRATRHSRPRRSRSAQRRPGPRQCPRSSSTGSTSASAPWASSLRPSPQRPGRHRPTPLRRPGIRHCPPHLGTTPASGPWPDGVASRCRETPAELAPHLNDIRSGCRRAPSWASAAGVGTAGARN